jgi:hypothetical protein
MKLALVLALFSSMAVIQNVSADNLRFSCNNGSQYEFTLVSLRSTGNIMDQYFAGAVTLASNGNTINGGLALPQQSPCVLDQPSTMQCGDKAYEFSRVALSSLQISYSFALVGTGILEHNGASVPLHMLLPSGENCILRSR